MSMNYLRKAASSEQAQCKKEVLRATSTTSATGADSPKLFQVHILLQIALMPDMELGDLMFTLLDFSLALIPFLCMSLFVSFGIGMFTLCYYMLKVFGSY